MFRLEDPDSEETKEFVEKQVKLTDSVLKSCETRDKLRDKLTELYDFPKYDAPFRAGDKYFYFHNTGLQPQKVLYIQVLSQNYYYYHYFFNIWQTLNLHLALNMKF